MPGILTSPRDFGVVLLAEESAVKKAKGCGRCQSPDPSGPEIPYSHLKFLIAMTNGR